MRHLAAARHLESAFPDEDEIVEVVASHYLEAFRAAPDASDAAGIKVRAREMLTRAGDRAASLAAAREAQRYFEQAAELGDDAVTCAELQFRAGRMAWRRGRGEEAEKLLGPQLEELLQGVEGGRRYEVTTVERGCEYALKIAQATGNAVWFSMVFRFYRAMRRLPPTNLVDEICAVARKVRQPNLDELRRYLTVVRGESGDLGPSERFLLGRLEGLERSLG